MRQADSGNRRAATRSGPQATKTSSKTPAKSATRTATGTDRRRAARKVTAETDAEVVDEAVIRLAEEHLSVAKRTVETGRVRVHRSTTERVKNVDVPLSSDTVEIKRVKIGREVTKIPAVRETRSQIIIPVVEEVLVVERRLVLREELHITKVRSVQRHTEQVTLRVQKATVERVAPQGSDGGRARAVRSEKRSGTGRSAKQKPQPRKRRSQ